jgi:Icc-related predicted phosphoesterase
MKPHHTNPVDDCLLDPELIERSTQTRPLPRPEKKPPPRPKPRPAPSHNARATLAPNAVQARVSWEVFQVEAVEGLAPMHQGYAPHVEVVTVRSSLFAVPVIAASDLHKDGLLVFQRLAQTLDASRWEVILCGDMAGTIHRGEDASPAPLYDFVQANFRRLHFVLGNHDIAGLDTAARRNSDGTPCQLDRAPREVGGRRLCGVSGIAGQPNKRNRLRPDSFAHEVSFALRENPGGSVLCTHDTPLIAGFTPFIGQERLAAQVLPLGPLAHLFGHCHLKPLQVHAGQTLFVDVDARVLLLEPAEA